MRDYFESVIIVGSTIFSGTFLMESTKVGKTIPI